jgi:acyl carrier protein|tara:strand:- start:903 stop:1154 length:252 start_codon:yes stop_codon:yes gene_type:complete
MKIDIENRIKTVMSSVLNISKSEIHNKTSSDTIKSWDSLKHMNIIVGLEEEFDIEFDADEIGNLLNYELIRIYILEILLKKND